MRGGVASAVVLATAAATAPASLVVSSVIASAHVGYSYCLFCRCILHLLAISMLMEQACALEINVSIYYRFGYMAFLYPRSQTRNFFTSATESVALGNFGKCGNFHRKCGNFAVFRSGWVQFHFRRIHEVWGRPLCVVVAWEWLLWRGEV